MKRVLLGGVAALLVIAAGATYWLFYDNGPQALGQFPLDLAAIRTEARRIPGPGPQHIEVEIVSRQSVPKIAMVAGTNWGAIDIARASYRLVFPDRSIIIDTTYDEASARASDADSYDRRAWQRVQAAMNAARAIVITHEHGDHLGGLVTSPNLAKLLPKALLNPEQFAESRYIEPLRWPAGSRAGYRPFRYQGMRAIAPGVMLIRAPGHTPGSQMIYARQSDGREYLFMGDVASEADNVRLQRIRSRLVTDFYTHENRAAVLRQVRALHGLAAAEPQLVLVPGHDADAIARLERAGLLVRGFSVP